VRLGLPKDLEEHRKKVHPEYCRWTRHTYLIVPPMRVLGGAMIAGLVFGQRLLSNVELAGMFVLLFIVIALGIWGERKYGRLRKSG
jgi:hypothetical protein